MTAETVSPRVRARRILTSPGPFFFLSLSFFFLGLAGKGAALRRVGDADWAGKGNEYAVLGWLTGLTG